MKKEKPIVQKVEIVWNNLLISIPIRSGAFYCYDRRDYTPYFPKRFKDIWYSIKTFFIKPRISLVRAFKDGRMLENPFPEQAGKYYNPVCIVSCDMESRYYIGAPCVLTEEDEKALLR